MRFAVAQVYYLCIAAMVVLVVIVSAWLHRTIRKKQLQKNLMAGILI